MSAQMKNSRKGANASLRLFLLLAVFCDSLADECGSTFASRIVYALAESRVCGVHLPEIREHLILAGIIIPVDSVLQLLHKSLHLFAVSGLFPHSAELREHAHQLIRKRPFLLRRARSAFLLILGKCLCITIRSGKFLQFDRRGNASRNTGDRLRYRRDTVHDSRFFLRTFISVT